MRQKIALVTGGAGAIGSACCRELAKAGFCVAVHYNQSKEKALALADELQETNSFVICADISKTQGIDAMYEELKGRSDIEVLVNNAGITADAPFLLAKVQDWDRIVSTNIKGAWYLTKKIAKLMIRNHRGRIINISSLVGSVGNSSQSIYAMTKAAMDSLTKTLAKELSQYNILVNSVAPGFIKTDMTAALSNEHEQEILERIPLRRMGMPDEVAQVVRFLAVEATYCTGSVFHVNGGAYGG